MRATITAALFITADVFAQPLPLESPELRRGIVALGISGDSKWYQEENALFLEGTVRPSYLPLFVHGEVLRGEQSYDDLGTADLLGLRAGGEVFACADPSTRRYCGFAGVDFGYLSVSGLDDIGGAIFAGRLGIDGGSRYLRGRIGVDITRPFGDRFDRDYVDGLGKPVALQLADMTYVFIAVAFQY